MTTNMDDKELIAALDDAAKWLATSRFSGHEIKSIEVCSVVCVAKERLEALQSPAGAGVVTLPEGTISMHGNDVTIMFGAREDAEAAFEVIEALTTPKPEAVGDQCDKCHRRYTAVYNVPNDLWAKIAPKPETLGDYPEHQYGGLLCPDCATDAAKALGVNLVLASQPPTPASGEPRHIETRNDEAGFTEFVNQDGPTVVREIDGRVAILFDMDTRDVVGYRVYDAPAASGEMEVVAWRMDDLIMPQNVSVTVDESFANHRAKHPNTWIVQPLVTLEAAQKAITAANERAERLDQAARAGLRALGAAEALNTTLSEALEKVTDEISAAMMDDNKKRFHRLNKLRHTIRAVLAALPAKQGGRS